MNGPLEWIGAIGAIVAAALIAGDFGRKVTGWAEELAGEAKGDVAAGKA